MVICDRDDFDGVDTLPEDWEDIEEVRSYDEAMREVAVDDQTRSVFDWHTHLGVWAVSRHSRESIVAFVVCQAFDLDSTTRSADYIQLYRGTTDTLAESLDFIQKCAVSIIDAIRQLQDSAPAA